MPTRLFYVSQSGKEYSYQDLLDRVSSVDSVSSNCYTDNTFEIFANIVVSLVYQTELTLLDADFSHTELEGMGVSIGSMSDSIPVAPQRFPCINDLAMALRESRNWKLNLYTSGTTGIPKMISHDFASITRSVRQGIKHQDSVWGFAYNPTHMAGLQVFFQALLNLNSIIDVFGLERSVILDRIDRYHITNISATPTFYRLLLPLDGTHASVRRITSGGEKFDPDLVSLLEKGFPNAQLRNIYASTEAGAILESKDDSFIITDPSLCKIEDGTLWINRRITGGFEFSGDWYDTGDLVSVISTNPTRFRFISRANEMINIGGYKVNPLEVETAINKYSGIRQSRVYGKPNKLLGNILLADVVSDENINERSLRDYLGGLLQAYKIPRIINHVNEINTTRTGKIKRI